MGEIIPIPPSLFILGGDIMARLRAICEHVEDGDTFRTKMKNWIRLANVCAPEKGQSGYEKAKKILEDLILNKEIVYEQVSTDKYGRIVAEVWLGNLHVNAYMRQQGYTC
jgi:endonuclease YncB( thermonuclease family)